MLLALSFLNGMRYILLHQLIDRENDIKSGINTYAVTKSASNIRNLIRASLFAEILGCCVVIMPIALAHPLLTVLGIAVQLVVEYSAYVVLVRYAGKDWLATFDSAPLDFFYNAVFPVLVVLSTASFSLNSAMGLVILVLLNARNIGVKFGFIRILLFKDAGMGVEA